MNAINRPRRAAAAASSPAPHLPNVPGPITPYALGLQLGAKKQEQHLLYILGGRVGCEVMASPLNNERFHQRQVKNAQQACDAECDALEDLILSSRAHNQADATVVTMIAVNRLSRLVEGTCQDDRELEEKRLWRALLGVIKVLAPAAGVQLADLGGRFYASSWADTCPTVDLSEVEPDATAIDTCIDGSGGAS